MIKLGLTYEQSEIVNETNVASAFGSGNLAVYATPAMIALMERAAWAAIQPQLEEGWTTVGISVDVRHLAASPIGMKIRAVAEISAVDRKKISFKVEAFDEAGKIGEGTHERIAIQAAEFVRKTAGKRRTE